MEKWKRNLYILCSGQFLTMSSLSCVTPFLPLYLQQMGLTDPKEVLSWTGLIYAANLVTAFLFSPIWGKLADRYGRKSMLVRSGIGMAVTITLMGFVTSPLQLLILRLINGMMTGFSPAAIAFTATNTPPERSGYALGILHASAVGGTICGPLLGSLLAVHFGFRAVFSSTGLCILLAAIIVIFWITESFEKKERNGEKTDFVQDFRQIVARKPIGALFVSAALVRAAMVGTLPLIPLYVQQLVPHQDNVVILAGVATAVMGIANMLSAPQLGKWGDRFGSERVFNLAVLGTITFSIPQAFVQQLWPFIALRFCTGACLGGMMPSLHVLIRQYAPKGMESRTYSYHNCAVFLGGIAGTFLMGAIATHFGLSLIFIGQTLLLIVNQLWMRLLVVPKLLVSAEK
ncbi:MFS transporter [Brevibacillus centrosporus]|uniref:MFS transporter n=1 Tax=Brevibacillus centrosporus TaxID=54910 RepID=UPI0039871D5D